VEARIPTQLEERCPFRSEAQHLLEDTVWKILVDKVDGMFIADETITLHPQGKARKRSHLVPLCLEKMSVLRPGKAQS
jgi:hypothetical protein